VTVRLHMSDPLVYEMS